MKPVLMKSDFIGIPGVALRDFATFKKVHSVSIDTRAIKRGSLFIAIKGERFDGHDYLKQAVEAGAACLMIQQESEHKAAGLENVPKVIVKDTTNALGHIAMTWRTKLAAKVISITGSNGKTGTKEMLLTLLGQSFKVHGTTANNNNHIGVPLTILQTPADTEYLILEHGTNHFGEIDYTAQIAAPDFALITNIGASHLEYLGSLAGVKKEKIALFDAAQECNGKVFINLEDKLLKTEVQNYKNVVTFGTKHGADVVYKHTGFTRQGTPKLKVTASGKTIECTIPLYGKTSALNAAAAIAIAINAGMNKTEILAGIKALQPAKHRLVPLEIQRGLIIDDTYNANPQSMLAGFEVLRNIKQYPNRWLILGDMFELGRDAAKLHKKLAPFIVKIPNVRVILLGDLMHELYMDLKKHYLPVWHCKTREQVTEMIKDTEFSKAVTLVKGSRGMKMEEFLNILKQRFE